MEVWIGEVEETEHCWRQRPEVKTGTGAMEVRRLAADERMVKMLSWSSEQEEAGQGWR